MVFTFVFDIDIVCIVSRLTSKKTISRMQGIDFLNNVSLRGKQLNIHKFLGSLCVSTITSKGDVPAYITSSKLLISFVGNLNQQFFKGRR